MKINQIKSGVILSYLSMFIGNIIAIVYTPIMLRLIGQNEYGIYSIAGSVIGYLGFLSFGFDSAYVRYYSALKIKNDIEGMKKLNGMFLTVFTVAALITVFAGTVITLNVDKIFKASLTSAEVARTKILMAVLVVNMAFSFPVTVFKCNITANEKYVFQKVLNIIKTILSPFIALPLLIVGYGSVGLVISTTILSIVVGATNIWYCIKRINMGFSFKNFDFKLLKEIAVFSLFIFINIIVDQVNWNVDKFLLGIFKGSAAVAVYGIASQINTYYMSFSTSVSSVLVPKINRLAADPSSKYKLNEIFIKSGRIQFEILSLVLTGLIFFGRPFFVMWAGNKYANSYDIALILTIPVTIPLIQTVAMEIQRSLNLHRFRAYLYLGMAVANVIFSIPLCKMYGGVGCAIGTAAALIIGNGIIMNIYYYTKVKLDIIKFWKEILKIIPALVAPVLLGIYLITKINLYKAFNFIFFIIIYIITYAVSLYLLGMNKYEKSLILKPLLKIFRKQVG